MERDNDNYNIINLAIFLLKILNFHIIKPS